MAGGVKRTRHGVEGSSRWSRTTERHHPSFCRCRIRRGAGRDWGQAWRIGIVQQECAKLPKARRWPSPSSSQVESLPGCPISTHQPSTRFHILLPPPRLSSSLPSSRRPLGFRLGLGSFSLPPTTHRPSTTSHLEGEVAVRSAAAASWHELTSAGTRPFLDQGASHLATAAVGGCAYRCEAQAYGWRPPTSAPRIVPPPRTPESLDSFNSRLERRRTRHVHLGQSTLSPDVA